VEASEVAGLNAQLLAAGNFVLGDVLQAGAVVLEFLTERELVFMDLEGLIIEEDDFPSQYPASGRSG
jgi:hypothetical protein